MSTYFDSYVDSHAIDPSGLVTKAVSALAVGSGVGLVGYAMQSLMPGILGLLTALVFVCVSMSGETSKSGNSAPTSRKFGWILNTSRRD